MREVIVTGKTVEEATEKACLELGLPREEVSIEILEMPTRRFFKSTPAKVKATADEPQPAAPQPAAPAKEAAPAPAPAVKKAEQPVPAQSAAPAPAAKQPAPAAPAPRREEKAVSLAENEKLAAAAEYLKTVFAAMGAGEVSLSAAVQGEAYIIKAEGGDVGMLIGHRGETMESLSYLAGLAANRLPGDYMKISLDVAGYRSKREKDLEALARRMGAKVARTGRSHTMDPMNPYERRIIHSTIGAMEGLRSESRGEGADRRVVIYSTDPTARPAPDRERRGRSGDRNGRAGRGGYGSKGGHGRGERRSGVPAREFADAPRAEGAAPTAPKRTQLIDDAEGFALYGKIEL